MRLGSAMSVLGFAHLGSSLSVRRGVKCGDNVYIQSALRFSDTTYLEAVSNNIQATVSGTRSMSLTSTGGTLHGTWTADTVVAVSDRRLKENIMPLVQTLQQTMKVSDESAARPSSGSSDSQSTLGWVLRQLRPVSYNFRKGSDAKSIRFGFIADEMEMVLPQVVRTLPGEGDGHDAKKGIVYDDLIAVLTATMREFSTQLKDVTARMQLAEIELDLLDQVEPMHPPVH